VDAGREMDALIAEKVFGHDRGFPEVLGERWIAFPERVLPRYSTDIAAAWPVLEKVHGTSHTRSTIESGPKGWTCRIASLTGHGQLGYGEGATAAEAICRAGLMASARW
jgi:hypothetical protein